MDQSRHIFLTHDDKDGFFPPLMLFLQAADLSDLKFSWWKMAFNLKKVTVWRVLSNLKSNPSHQQLSLCFIRKVSALSLLFVCSEPEFCVLPWGCGRRWLLPPPWQLRPVFQSLQQWSLIPPFPPLSIVVAPGVFWMHSTKQGWLSLWCGSGCPGHISGSLGVPGCDAAWPHELVFLWAPLQEESHYCLVLWDLILIFRLSQPVLAFLHCFPGT